MRPSSSPIVRQLTFEDLSEQRERYRDIRLDNMPDNIQLHGSILMDQDVPHAAHTGPINARVARLGCVGDVAGGLADDLDIAEHGIDDHFVG
jgi:hypothetical protein